MHEKFAESEELLSESTDSLEDRPRHHQRSCLTSWISIGALVFSCSVVAALLGFWVGSRWFRDPDLFCLRYTNKYSPVVDEANLSYSVIRFNGSLLKPNAFRQDAGPEVDAAWKSLGVDYRALSIPDDKAAQSGLLPDQVKISQKYGGGYPANVEGLHQLHCLGSTYYFVNESAWSKNPESDCWVLIKNLLRKSLWFNYDYYHKQGLGPFSNNDYIVKFHVTHCLDIIRQQLMCQTDTAVLGQVWIQPGNDTHPSAYVDFNTYHKCKSFDAVRQWAEARQLPENAPQDFLEPPKPGDRIYLENP